MAVPKQKQSHSRTTKRRSQHKITAPSVNTCPQCRQPRRPHRVCPHCGSYGGREVVDLPARSRSRPRPLGRRPRWSIGSRSRSTRTGPTSAPVRWRAAPRIAAERGDRRRCCSAPPASWRARRRRGRRRAGLDRQGRRPRAGGALARPRPRSSRPWRPSPPAAPTRSSPAARPARRSPPRCSASSAPAACTARRSRSSCPCPARRSCCSTRAPTSPCGRSTSSSSRTWAPRSWRS